MAIVRFSLLFSLMGLLFLASGNVVRAEDAAAQPVKAQEVVMAGSENISSAAQGFVDGLTKRGIAFLQNPDLTKEQRKKEFKALLRSSFDMKTIGRFTLGRYWKAASKAQQEEYLRLFERSVVESYARRFEEYKGQAVQVKSARPEGEKDTIVSSTIVSPDGGPDVQVDWRVRPHGSSFKVVDVIVEGVSMAVTQRSDFASVIQRGGGNLDVLLDHLRQG